MGNALENREEGLLEDLETESDEMYQNSGEKGIKHPDPDDPPRRRANKKRGSATGETTDLAYSAPLGGKAVK